MASFYLLINLIDSLEKHMLRQRSVKRIEFHFDQMRFIGQDIH
jgi:hypothetical protein